MADSTDLKLRIVPELDESAKRKVQDELDKFTASVPVVPSGGAKGGGVGATQAQTKAIKDQNIAYNEQGQIIGRLTQEHKKYVDQLTVDKKANELVLRMARTRAEGEIQALQQKAAVGQITLDQMNQGITEQTQIIVQAEELARQQYAETVNALQGVADQYAVNQKEIVNAQQGVGYSIIRLNDGFNSMSGSMQKVTSQTKNANLAFMNFGRIVQDAPFGLIGIANNIDPMLVTFANLSKEIDVTTGKMRGFGGAMSQLGKQLLGPAGIIFLLGSALPSALLVLQSHKRKTAKEADLLGDAFKKVADEFAKLSSQAASERGLPQVTKELVVVNKQLDVANEELAKMEAEFAKIAEEQSRALAATGAPREAIMAQEQVMIGQLREQNKERLTSLDRITKGLTAQKESLDANKQEIEDRKFIREEAEKRGTAEIFFLQERQKQTKKLTDLEIRTIELTNAAQGEVLRNVEKLKDEIRAIANDPQLWGTPQGMKAIQALRKEITKTQSVTAGFINETLEQQARLRIAYENNLYLAQDENLTYEQRQKFIDISVGKRRAELVTQKELVDQQLKSITNEEEIGKLKARQIEIGKELNSIDGEGLGFDKKIKHINDTIAKRRQELLAQNDVIQKQLETATNEQEIATLKAKQVDISKELYFADTNNNLAIKDRQAYYENIVSERKKQLFVEQELLSNQIKSANNEEEIAALKTKQLQITKELNLADFKLFSLEERQQNYEAAINFRRMELGLQKQSLETQLAQENEEEKKIPIRVQLIQLGQELNLLDRKALEIAQEREDAEFNVWMARQQAILDLEEQLRVFESESASSLLGDVDIDDSLAQARFASATEWIDRQSEYEIEKAIYVGDRIKALALEKDLFITQQRRRYIDEGYDAEIASAMAISDANKEFAIAEVQLRKEVNQELFAAIGEFAGQALTAIFGDNKKVAIAQVVIDTLMGVQKIWSQAGLNPIVGGLASAALIAKGATAIRKISKTEVGGSSISADNQSPVFVTSQDSYEVGNSRITRRTPPLISQNMANSTAAMLSNPMMNNSDRISVTANVDRRGLAIAVREGERSIRTQQFDFR